VFPGPMFLAPQMLWLLAVVPMLVWFYLYLLRRKKNAAVRFTNIALVKEAVGKGANIRRHIPPALLLAAITVSILAVAKPAALVTLPSDQSLVILAMDVSISMRATDIEPDRITAAQNAAKAFISEMPASVRIGVVAFAGSAMLAQAPTVDRHALISAIDGFRLQRATNLGGAILVSLESIFPGIELDMQLPEYERRARSRNSRSLDQPLTPEADNRFMPVPPGSYESAVIILLTDGQATMGPDPIAAARVAADRGVRVFTVGLGSKDGEISGWGGRRMRVSIDEETLKTVADLTKGQYFFAGSGASLTDIYKQLNTQLVMERKKTEVSFIFAAIAAMLAIAGCGLSLVWFNRPF
jgi:Ca-activated chloride channel family protein